MDYLTEEFFNLQEPHIQRFLLRSSILDRHCFAWFEGSFHQATWGKRKTSLRVLDADRTAIFRPSAFLRNLLKSLPWQLGHKSVHQLMAIAPGERDPVLITVGFTLDHALAGAKLACIVLTKKGRTPYDRVARAAST